MNLHSERIDLRPVSPDDTDVLHALWTTAGVRRFLWDDKIIAREQTAEIIATSQKLFWKRQFGLWLAWVPARITPVGFGGFWHFRDPPELELLFGVDESHWRAGYATEIGRAVVQYGFGALGFNRIQASTDADNLASVRVLEKLGFRFLNRTVAAGLDTRFYELTRTGTSHPDGGQRTPSDVT